jgi:hypothetical protein
MTIYELDDLDDLDDLDLDEDFDLDDDDIESLEALDVLERREYISNFVSYRTLDKELTYDYEPDDYPYGFSVDV